MLKYIMFFKLEHCIHITSSFAFLNSLCSLLDQDNLVCFLELHDTLFSPKTREEEWRQWRTSFDSLDLIE